MVACAAMHGPSTDSTAGKHQTLTEHYRRTFFCARIIFLKSFEMHQGDILYLNVWHLQDKKPVQNDCHLHVPTHWHGILQWSAQPFLVLLQAELQGVHHMPHKADALATDTPLQSSSTAARRDAQVFP